MADCGGTSLKFNNLRIPIGVSTQKSPYKFASNPYPTLLEERKLEANFGIISIDMDTFIFPNDSYLPDIKVGKYVYGEDGEISEGIKVTQLIFPIITYETAQSVSYGSELNVVDNIVIRYYKPAETFTNQSGEILTSVISVDSISVIKVFNRVIYISPEQYSIVASLEVNDIIIG